MNGWPLGGVGSRSAAWEQHDRHCDISGGSALLRQAVEQIVARIGLRPALGDTVDQWAAAEGSSVLVILDEIDAHVKRCLRGPRSWRAVALVEGLNADLAAMLLAHGCDGIADLGATTEEIEAVVVSAMRGKCLIDSHVARGLVGYRPAPGELPISMEEAEWLRRLGDGVTVATLADEIGYSERQMFRMLYGTYARLGVKTRSQALVAAVSAGLLDAPRC